MIATAASAIVIVDESGKYDKYKIGEEADIWGPNLKPGIYYKIESCAEEEQQAVLGKVEVTCRTTLGKLPAAKTYTQVAEKDGFILFKRE